MNRTWRLMLVAGVLLAAGAGIAWWQFGSPPRLDPPMPRGVQEAEIVRLLERHQAKVLAKREDANAWGDYAQVLLAHLFSAEARICFAEAARLAPADPRWRYGQAQLALKLDPPLAEELLRQTIATTGPGEEFRVAARLVLGELLVERGDLDRAAEFFEAESSPSNGNLRSAYGLGLVAMARKDSAAARRYFAMLLKNPYSRKQAHIYLARLARMQGDSAAAQKFATDAAALTEDLAWPDPLLDHTMHLAVGRRSRDRMISEHEKAGNFDAALQLCLAQLNEERSAKALLAAGANCIRLHDFDRALELVREAVEKEPRSPLAQYTMSLAYYTPAERELDRDPRSEKGREYMRKALDYAKQAAELKPDHARAHLHWGMALHTLGQSKEALAPLRKGLIARPNDFDLHFALGLALASIGETEEARTEFRRAGDLEPANPHVAAQLARLKKK